MSGAAQGPAWWRKRPVTVQGIPWTGANADAVTAFAGGDKFTPYALVRNGELEVWNEQERHWLPCPAGHVVMRGALGELYPVSPAALEVTYDPAGGREAEEGTPGQAALRLAVITEVREAASCGSGDGDQCEKCEKCTRHADAILAAVAAHEPPAVPGDAGRLAIALAALRKIWEDGDDYSASATAEEALSDIADLSPRLRPQPTPAPELADATASTALRSEQTGLEGSGALDGWNEETGMAP